MVDLKNNLELNQSIVNDSKDTRDVNNEVANCLALTVKKDYNLSILKHVCVGALRSTWRISFAIFVLNILKFFL